MYCKEMNNACMYSDKKRIYRIEKNTGYIFMKTVMIFNGEIVRDFNIKLE